MKVSLLVSLLFASLSAFAANDPCSLSGQITLEEPTTITCLQNLKVEEDTKIVTNGHPLQILVAGNAELSNLQIVSFVGDEKAQAGEIYLYARTASGRPDIDNQGVDASGEVHLEFASVNNYDHVINVNELARVDVSLNGLPVDVTAPQYKITIQ